MPIEVEAHVSIPRPRDQVFEAAAGKTSGLSKYFTGYPPLIPAIAEATLEGGDPPRAGAIRNVKMGDGTRIIERILAFETPSLHRYDMVKMNPLQSLLCSNMVAEWSFEERGAHTFVTWRYAVHPKPFRGFLPNIVAALLKRAMQRCLDNLAADLR